MPKISKNPNTNTPTRKTSGDARGYAIRVTLRAHCQSCGMSMKRDEQGGDTNVDGSKNAMCCSHCYQRGEFALPDITPEKMQTRVREKLIAVGIPAFLTYFLTRGIPRLARWHDASIHGKAR